jgi:transketolase
LFDKQELSYRQKVIGDKKALRVAIEAAVGLGWERYIGEDGLMIGMADFGASAPCQDLMQHFGFTAEAIVPKILRARKEM